MNILYTKPFSNDSQYKPVLCVLTVGNMDDRMAEAVERACVVLMCFSEKYQASKNCKKGKIILDIRHSFLYLYIILLLIIC